jgi:hypothetical protein
MFWSNPKNYIPAILIVILFALPIAVNAISEATMMFLAIEPGSRANGMGNAYVGVVDDAYAGWWNPGATAFNRKTQFAGMHSNWLEGSGINDLYYEYFGWNQHFNEIGNLGLNIVWMDFGTQEQTDANGNSLGTFSSNEFAATAIYGAEVLPNKIGLGLGFKFLYSNLGPGTGATEEDTKGKTLSFAFDIGSKFKDVLTPRFDIGLVMQNIGPDVTYINDEQKDPLPMTMRLGLAYRIFDTITYNEDPGLMPVGSFKQKLTVSADASKILANEDPVYQRIFSAWADDDSKYELESTVFSVGAEYNYLDMISLRGGYFYDKAGSITGPSFGVGFHYTFSEKYRIFADFAMITGGDLVDYNKTFSLGLEF